ncbi:MAG: hypothetical protein AB8F34_01450 [Akkermansiaceae bacterium]
MKLPNLRLLFVAVVCLFTLCQCSTNQVYAPKPGEAYLNALPEAKHRSGLKGMRIATVNGKQVDKRATPIHAGSVNAVVSVNWPGVGKVNIPMKFRARERHSYFIKYDVYPHVGSNNSGKGNGEGPIKEIFSGGDPYGALAAVFIVPVVVTAVLTKKAVQHYSGSDRDKDRAMKYIDLMVVSRLSSEGVVSHMRAYPSRTVNRR